MRTLSSEQEEQVRNIPSDISNRKIARDFRCPVRLINKLRPIKKGANPKKIRQVSKKMTSGMALYKEAKAEIYKHVSSCQICGNTESLSIHHIAGRSGKLLYDKGNMIVVCMAGSTFLNDRWPESNKAEGCHNWIEKNLSLSRELGYSKSKVWKPK